MEHPTSNIEHPTVGPRGLLLKLQGLWTYTGWNENEV
jgi:hypothetical protein